MRRILNRIRRDERGFTIIEVMVAAAVLMVGVVGTIQMVNVANVQTVEDQGREAATNVAREVVEAANAVDYDSLTPTGTTTAMQALPGFATQGSPGWVLKRRGVFYTITATACTVDDRVDGFRAPSATGTFCPQSNQTDAGQNYDRNPDDFRRTTVNVTWTREGRTRTVTQSTVVNNPGDAAGPAVTSVTPSVPSPVTSAAVTSITFTAAVTVPPKTTAATTVKFMVDGVVIGNATQAGASSWTYVWQNINRQPDATYIVSMQAFDAKGRSRGASITRMVIDRNALAPPSLQGGRNVRLKSGTISLVDLEWPASTDPDVFGYRVYRSYNGVTTKICETSREGTGWGSAPNGWISYTFDKDYLSCVDQNAPHATNTIYYGVTALDHDPSTGAVRETTGYAYDAVGSGNQPNAVRRPTLTRDAEGHVVLTWSAPNGNPQPAFYRIYRNGTAIGNRYDRTASTETDWTDLSSTSTSSNTYYVMGVDGTTMGESDPSPSVTG